MSFLNIGLPEIFFVLILMLIFLGPEDMHKNALKLGRLIRKMTRSETWRTFMGTYQEVKKYPSQVMKDLELEEIQKSLHQDLEQIQKSAAQEADQINQEIQHAARGASQEPGKADPSEHREKKE